MFKQNLISRYNKLIKIMINLELELLENNSEKMQNALDILTDQSILIARLVDNIEEFENV
jgi:hypothetical protein